MIALKAAVEKTADVFVVQIHCKTEERNVAWLCELFLVIYEWLLDFEGAPVFRRVVLMFMAFLLLPGDDRSFGATIGQRELWPEMDFADGGAEPEGTQ